MQSDTARPRPLPPLRLLALAGLALSVAIVLWCAREAYAQQPQRGTGYTASHAQWEDGKGKVIATYRIDQSARPWGLNPPYLKDSTLAPPEGRPLDLYWQRYTEGRGQPFAPEIPGDPTSRSTYPIGATLEAMSENLDALKAWYAAQPAAHRAMWDGEPTIEEAYDASFSNQYPSAFYGGGSAVLIDSASAWDRHVFILNDALRRGLLRMGEVWSIKLVGDAASTDFLIQWMPGGQPVPTPSPTASPSPPPPVSTPTPAPLPSPTPQATPCPECPPPPVCAQCKPRCLPFDAGEGLTMARIRQGRTPSIERLQALVRAIDARSGCWPR